MPRVANEDGLAQFEVMSAQYQEMIELATQELEDAGIPNSITTEHIAEALGMTTEFRGGSLPSGAGAWLDTIRIRTIIAAANNNPVPRIDDTYDSITEGGRGQRIRYAGGQRHCRSRFGRNGYRPVRELPLDGEYCRCEHFDFDVRPHVLAREQPRRMRQYQAELGDMARRGALGVSGPFDAWNGRDLVEQRQARAMAGLDTSECDGEIARRVLEDARAWGWIGGALTGFVRDRYS